jgi:hypothetical protein
MKKIEHGQMMNNANAVHKQMGSRRGVSDEREIDDFYATDPKAAQMAIKHLGLSSNLWECACGEGHLSKVFVDAGYKVKSTDLVYRGYGEVLDFLSDATEPFLGDIITNPPFKYATHFIEKAIAMVGNGNKVCMFLKLLFLEGSARNKFFIKYPPKTVWVFSSRIACAKGGDFDSLKAKGSPAVANCWYVWEKGYAGITEIKWIN